MAGLLHTKVQIADQLAELQKQFNTLKSTTEMTKKKLARKTEDILDLKSDMKGLKGEIQTLEEQADEKDAVLAKAQQDLEQYRNWWLGEVQFTKLILNKVPKPNEDIELVRQSQSHYLGHY